MQFFLLASGATAYTVGMPSAPVQYAPSAVQYAPVVQYAPPAAEFLAPRAGVPMMNAVEPMIYELPYEPAPQPAATSTGVWAALAGLGALVGYGVGRHQAALAVTGKPAPAVRRIAAPIMADDIEGKLKGIIAEQLGVDAEKVVPDASFTEDLGADSLDAVELIMAIEEAFDIEIPDEEAEKMTTPKDCIAAISAKL